MKGLFIDTASQKGVAVLFEGGLPRLSRHFPSMDGLMPELERLMKEAGLTPKDLQFVAAGYGPGSFTGIRIGQMTARAFSYALNIPIYGISSLALYSKDWPVISDARMGGFWAQLPGESPKILSHEEILETISVYSQILSPDTRILAPKLVQLGFQGEVLEGRVDPLLIGELLIEEIKKGGSSVPDILYLKKDHL